MTSDDEKKAVPTATSSSPSHIDFGRLFFGRLIRVGDRRAGPDVVYVVAEADPEQAMEIIRRNVTGPGVELEDLGRVNEGLLRALGLQQGQFTRT
jgi:hypothetical protein